MPNRREFVRSAVASGISFVSCSLLSAQSSGSKSRRQVNVGGRKVRTVDVHAHCNVPAAFELIGRKPTANEAQAEVSIEERLRHMDGEGIDVQAISINPFWYAAERDLAAKIVQTQNEALAELCAMHPDRFVAYATVALQHPDLAVQQFETGIRKLGLRGVSIGASVNGEEVSSARFDPFWAKAEQMGALIFMHPRAVPELEKRLRGNGLLTNVIGNPLETTIALSHLIFDGTLDRFPNLKLCAAHGGGFLPSYADRSDHGCLTFPESCTPIRKHPTEYLKQLYFDSLVFSPEALRHLVAQCGPSQIVVGTDYPYPWTESPVDHVLKTPTLSDADKRAILGGTAAKLLGIPA